MQQFRSWTIGSPHIGRGLRENAAAHRRMRRFVTCSPVLAWHGFYSYNWRDGSTAVAELAKIRAATNGDRDAPIGREMFD